MVQIVQSNDDIVNCFEKYIYLRTIPYKILHLDKQEQVVFLINE